MTHTPSKRAASIGASLAALALGLLPLAASAQTLSYGDGGDGGESAGAAEGGKGDQDASHRRGSRSGSYVAPYIEAQQVVSAELSPGSEVLTYSRVAAGVDATLAGRNSAASLSLRYERQIGWGKASSGDTISGLARGYASIIPQTLRIDAGVMASRSRVEQSGAAVLGPVGNGNDVTKLYSVYAGPTLTTQMGEAKVDAHYRIGYTKVDSSDDFVTAGGQPTFDIFDESVAHDAGIHIGTRPGTVLPVGIGARGGLLPRGYIQSRPEGGRPPRAARPDTSSHAGARAGGRSRLRKGRDFEPRCAARCGRRADYVGRPLCYRRKLAAPDRL